MFQDISQDHAKKTVTIEAHPHLGYRCAFIHPCKHASIISKFISRCAEDGHSFGLDNYFCLLLKLLGAMIPAIDVDYTEDVKI